jgi:hypothetical protein
MRGNAPVARRQKSRYRSVIALPSKRRSKTAVSRCSGESANVLINRLLHAGFSRFVPSMTSAPPKPEGCGSVLRTFGRLVRASRGNRVPSLWVALIEYRWLLTATLTKPHPVKSLFFDRSCNQQGPNETISGITR